jgi:hypothetical protein
VDDHAIKGGIVNRDMPEIYIRERQVMLDGAQEVLRRVALETECTSSVQRVCDYLAQIFALPHENPDLNSQNFLPPSATIPKSGTRYRF